MIRQTVTLTDYRGVKVRTVVGKTFYVVIPDGQTKAKVIKRTDSALTAHRELNRWNGALVYRCSATGKVTQITLERIAIYAAAEKRQVAARKAEIALLVDGTTTYTYSSGRSAVGEWYHVPGRPTIFAGWLWDGQTRDQGHAVELLASIGVSA